MNKRQVKKMHKKVIYPFVDEMNLLTLSQEELENAIADFNDYVFKHCRYKHYKDKEIISKRFCLYTFPVGESVRNYYETILSRAASYQGDVGTINQTIEDLKSKYPEEMQKILEEKKVR